ncbi:MAG: acyl-CoA dehydrogenase [Rhodospirillaceae bacterium]|nr:acyl-CoA dehydrogenase [Rhodospirillaceae bacterium]|tara:strand:- start:1013 stop:2176 length:1164 start_codon:yes stop_codon:yes gene_type:complete
MDFLTQDQEALDETISRICADFGDDYWLARDTDGNYPEKFVAAIADGGWLGIAMPEAHGGAGLGVTEAALMMRRIAQSGGGFAAASSVHINIFGPHPIVKYGTPEQQARLLPPLIQGRDRTCFGITEPNAGLDTGAIETRAEWDGSHYVVHGQKLWTSTAQRASKIMLLARTEGKDIVAKSTDGLSLFYTDLDQAHVEIREIAKMGRKAVDSNALFIDGLKISRADLIGEEGEGFHCLLDGLNPERILIGAEAIGLGRCALTKAVNYAREREVFGRPIGQNQAIQHPLAEAWAELEAADLMVFKAARLYDAGEACGAEANAGKHLAAEAAHKACERAVLTLGGMGYAKEYHVERYLRESYIARIAPVSREMILNFIAERVLDLPRSY